MLSPVSCIEAKRTGLLGTLEVVILMKVVYGRVGCVPVLKVSWKRFLCQLSSLHTHCPAPQSTDHLANPHGSQPLSPAFSSIQSLPLDSHNPLHQLSIQPLSLAPHPHSQLPAPHAGRQLSSNSATMYLCPWVPQFTQPFPRLICQQSCSQLPYHTTYYP